MARFVPLILAQFLLLCRTVIRTVKHEVDKLTCGQLVLTKTRVFLSSNYTQALVFLSVVFKLQQTVQILQLLTALVGQNMGANMVKHPQSI